jgi:hypothetical protein
MRYINITNWSPDSAWLKSAANALSAVRALEKAGRSKAINGKQELWKDLKDRLKALSHEKCWYCESIEVRSDNAVDHFRPKGNVKDADPPHEGYWWLAFEWRNYRFTCTFCNSFRTTPETAGGKHDYFPLWDEKRRAYKEEDLLDDEIPLLIDPTTTDVSLIAFADDGSAGPAVPESEDKLQHSMAITSVKGYHLNQPTVKERRFQLLNRVRTLVNEADGHLKRYARDRTAAALNSARARMREIRAAASHEAEYSAAVRHLLAGLATHSDAARQVLKA